MSDTVARLFTALWADFVHLSPQARTIRQLLGGEAVRNDHIALRGLALPGYDIAALSAAFVELGYRAGDEYRFEAKKLFARHFEPADPRHPKVFISELLVEHLSEPAQVILRRAANEGREQLRPDRPLCLAGRPWSCSADEYERLLEESEYAAWVAAFGFRANHFTVAVHDLPEYTDLAAVNQTLRSAGFALNTSGGDIKGSPVVGLEQSSTLAEPVEVEFSDGRRTIPGVFYEFALRHPIGALAEGRYEGFVTGNAEKIFESTDARS